jgi:DNA topoisomerase I
MRILVLVESPAKAKPIAKYLSRIDPKHTYTVLASYGHVRDLKRKELSIEIVGANRFEPTYDVLPEKQEVVERLRAAVKKHDLVLLASDQDREGESIAWHVLQITRPKAFKRITFNEITEKGLREALAHPRAIDMDLVNAQQARRMLDRLVGFKLSPVLWRHFESGRFQTLSAGRVQSAALKLVADKEMEVQAHDGTQSYWTLQGDFELFPSSYRVPPLAGAKYYQVADGRAPTAAATIRHWTRLQDVRDMLKQMPALYAIADTKLHRLTTSPPPPFITSSLQQEANSKLGLDIKRTMALAQQLYEQGHITYMRTDSYQLSQDALDQLHQEVQQRYGDAYLEPRTYGHKKATKGAQEAHEAIRPTRASAYPLREAASIKEPLAAKLYALIWQRAMASQMAAAVYDELEVRLQKKEGGGGFFMGKHKTLAFDGFLAVYPPPPSQSPTASAEAADNKKKQKSHSHDAKALYALLQQEGRAADVPCTQLMARHTWTSPPSRYNESSIVKVLEKEGIGRPSTYANILTKLYEKQYVLKQNVAGRTVQQEHMLYDPVRRKLTMQPEEATIGAESSRLVPTQVGLQIDQFLRTHFADLVDAAFTAGMEDELDRIAQGQTTDQKVLSKFWKDFSKRLEVFNGNGNGNSSTTRGKSAATRATKAASSREPPREQLAEQATRSFPNVGQEDGSEAIVRLAKYGPVIQHHGNVYIGLKPYLHATKKGYMDLEAEDVAFLVSLPRPVAQGKAHLHYGRYGFYLKIKDEGFPIPYAIQKRVPKTEPWQLLDALTPADVRAVVDSKRKALAAKAAAAATATTADGAPGAPPPPPPPRPQHSSARAARRAGAR